MYLVVCSSVLSTSYRTFCADLPEFFDLLLYVLVVFFFQAEDGIRDHCVTGVQTCALPIWISGGLFSPGRRADRGAAARPGRHRPHSGVPALADRDRDPWTARLWTQAEIGRASCRERVERWGGAGRKKK